MSKKNKIRSVIGTFMGAIILLLVSLILFHEQILITLGDYLIVNDDLTPADVLHVIAGDDYRTQYAIQLYQMGLAKTLFFTGGWCAEKGWYHGEHSRDLALSQGVPIEAIAYDDTHVTSTYSETSRLQVWIIQNPETIRSVIVVSDPFHMRRVRWTNRFILGREIKLMMAPVPFIQTPYLEQWWQDASAISYVREEYIKSIYYFLRYQLSIDSLAILDTE